MNKLGIWAIAIATAFVIGVLSANPVVEAAEGWKAAVIELNDDISDIELFLEERSDFWEFLEEGGEEAFESQVYEVSAVSLVPAEGSVPHIGNQVQLRCLDGDWFLGQKEADKPVALSVDDPTVVIENEEIISRGSIIEEFERGIAVGFAKKIGWDGRAEQNRGLQLDDIPVTITGLCFSPSP